MQSSSEGNLLEIIDLAHSLRQEHLYISNEQNTFLNLNDTLIKNSSNVAQLAWICAQQRKNLNYLILSRPDTGPSACCQKAHLLENTKFVDAYKAKGIKYQHVLAYIELFNFLHRSPYLLAQSLEIGDRVCRITPDNMNSVVHTIATGLYGNVILSKDVDMVLRLLRELIEIQIVVSDNPRRMLRAGSCAFSRLYHRLHESLFSAKLFLTAALHEPIMKVLIEDDVMLDIDPIKAVANYPAKDKLRKFGQEGTAEYEQNIAKYRHDTINSLYHLAKLFIQSLSDNWALFPSTLRWVVQTMCHLLKRSLINNKEINDILTDMVFTNFICPAVVSPDLFGISDAPISENARFNLIQIGQILQMLALVKHEDIDGKFLELFEMFDRNVVSELMDQLLETEYDVSVSMLPIPHQNDFGRGHVLVTQHELNIFVDFLRNVLENDGLAVSGDDRRKLGKILDQLPDKWESMLNGDAINVQQASPPNDHSSKAKQSLINLGKSTKNKLAKTMSLNVPTNGDVVTDDGGASGATCTPNGHTANGGLTPNHNNNYSYVEFEQVLVIPIAITEESKFQLLTEQEVLNMNNISNEIEPIDKNIDELDKIDAESENEVDDDELRGPSRKPSRFSLSNDDQSIGNTSDNLEVVSEAPSNHSVTSSLEMEENDQNLNDNLSDMVSANVSGRGTPNISGRDTPSSQVTEGENPPIPSSQMAKILSKARSDIDDKFCKFEIKKLVEVDETISIISDTWSTDVLASDSETIEPSDCEQRNFSTPLIPSAVILPGDNNFQDPLAVGSQLRANLLDSSETRSESAWSTDVLASDSEKITEIDTDDNQSIAANSDITDAGRSESDLRDGDVINRAPDSPFFAPRTPYPNPFPPLPANPSRNAAYSATPRSSDSSVFSSGNKSFEATSRRSAADLMTPRLPSEDFARFLSPLSSHPTRTSSRDSNRYSDAGNAFRNNQYQNNFRPSAADHRETFFPTFSGSKMRRQNSAESSISNQSSNYEDGSSNGGGGGAGGSSSGGGGGGASGVPTKKKNYRHPMDYAAAPADIVLKTSTDIINPFADAETDELSLYGNEVTNPLIVDETVIRNNGVEQRRISMEQRNASYDGRRNGMSPFGVQARQAASLCYENHEIISPRINSLQIVPSPLSPLTPEPRAPLTTSATDDDKLQHDEFLLIQKTATLNLGNETIAPEAAAPAEEEAGNSAGGAAKSSRYTGVIPKSISFDASADKNTDRNYMRRSQDANAAHRQNGSSGFFNKLKQNFKNRRNNNSHTIKLTRGTHNNDDYTMTSVFPASATANKVRGNFNADALSDVANFSNSRPTAPDTVGFFDPNEDILAKYRRKISSSSEATNSDSIGNARKNSHPDVDQRIESGGSLLDDGPYLFNNAKRKLRLVLSTTDLHTADFRHTSCHKTPPLLTYLQIQLAQALNLQNLQQISFVSEAIRCLRLLDVSQQTQLVTELRQDLRKRQTYLQYLMRYRQHLLSALENIDRFEDRLRNDRDMCNRHLIMVCVRMFLEKRDKMIEQFQEEFGAFTICDEKIDFMEEFMVRLMEELTGDGILQGMADWQLHEAKNCIERILLQRLYRQVMFPNDDGDTTRDEVLHKHIRKLSRLITPSHPALRIPQEFLIEAPWPFAQQQISYISAYKTPREKVQCVVRCITSIMNLLHMASSRLASADDLIPVLIYVIIKANPPYLLSTIQYVNDFIGDKLEGENHYWWTQFSSAVTFIKTMDYGD